MLLIIFLTMTLITMGIYTTIAPSSNKYLNPISSSLNSLTSFNDKKIANFISGSEGTLSVFIYLDPTQRSSTYQTVRQSSDSVNASVSDDYGVNFNIYSLGSSSAAILTFKQFPGSSSGVDQAQIRITTVKPGTSTTPNVETFLFEAIPLQKWVCVTLARSGRRYTVSYNDKIITSFRTKYYPVIATSSAWIIGDTKSSGYYAYAMASTNAFVLDDIKSQMQSVSDSRNKPILPNLSVVSIFKIFEGCPNGIFCYTASHAPSSGINKWSSPFA
jgi:hypothetical protein